MNPQVDAFLKKIKQWREEITLLRAIALDCGLTEEFKWNKPAYSHEGALVLVLGDFKNYCLIMFRKGVLLKDPKKLLVKAGENTQSMLQMRFTSAADIKAQKATIKAYILEAIAVEKAGLEVKFKTITEHAVPAELEAKFKKEPKFEKAFRALTPGRQRAYLIHFSSAKQAATRESRIEKCAPRILAGKGMSD